VIHHTEVAPRTHSKILNRPRAKSVLAIFAALLLLALVASAQTQTHVVKTAAAKEAPVGPPIKAYGSKSAPITMEVFTDYQCPMCRAFFEQTLRTMIAQYVASGKVYLIHHDYPLSQHVYSGQAARWANAAARDGQFENVEGALYDNQTAWEGTGDIQKYVSASMSPDEFKRVQQQMQGCAAPGPVSTTNGAVYPAGGHPCPLDPFITQDIAAGNKLPVHVTPTWVITYKGKRLAPSTGAVSWPILKQFFDSLLSS
jgi:hypothetical protein